MSWSNSRMSASLTSDTSFAFGLSVAALPRSSLVRGLVVGVGLGPEVAGPSEGVGLDGGVEMGGLEAKGGGVGVGLDGVENGGLETADGVGGVGLDGTGGLETADGVGGVGLDGTGGLETADGVGGVGLDGSGGLETADGVGLDGSGGLETAGGGVGFDGGVEIGGLLEGAVEIGLACPRRGRLSRTGSATSELLLPN